MEPFHILTIGLGVLGFFVQSIVLAVAGTRALGRIETSLRDAISEHRTQNDSELGAIRRDLLTDTDRIRREFGEGLAAIRTKVTEVELFNRDTYVRRDSFYKVAETFQQDMKTMSAELKGQLEKIDGKLERLRERVPPAE